VFNEVDGNIFHKILTLSRRAEAYDTGDKKYLAPYSVEKPIPPIDLLRSGCDHEM
jgi:hypothetical protein